MDGLDSGTQFDFTYAPGTSEEQILGFEMAGQIWSSYLEDDVTVRIYVESTDELPEDVVGAALPDRKVTTNYEKLKKQLSADDTSSDDSTALGNLPSSEKEFSVVIGEQELNKTKEFELTNANAKALGLLKDDGKRLDGYIQVNDLAGQSTTGWDYDALRGGNGGGGIDFLSVAMHEVGHVLGFVSGIDDNDWLEVLTEAQRKDKELKDKDFKFATPLDLFRYSDNEMSAGKIDLSTGGNPYFSIDGGNTNLANFSSGAYTDFGGDGYQASHWKNGSGVGIMNPVLGTGEKRNASSVDLLAMDVIGWDIDNSELDWQQMYDNAIEESEAAVLQDPKTIEKRGKDALKMVKDSKDKYKGRWTPRGGTSYSWQNAFWQYTTLDNIASSEIPEIVDSASETESTLQSSDDTGLEAVASNDQQQDPLLSGGLTDGTESTDSMSIASSEMPEIVDSASETESTLQSSDDTGLEAVASDDQQQDPLLSGGLMYGTESTDSMDFVETNSYELKSSWS